jgi:hypothetical protein
MNDDAVVSGNTASTSSASISDSSGGGVAVEDRGTFTMNDGAVSGNTATATGTGTLVRSAGGGVYIFDGTFTMNDGSVSGNTATAISTGTLVASIGGGVSVTGAFTMSGGAISGNMLSGAHSYAREALIDGLFNISGDARPERILLNANTWFITISGPLSGEPIPIDLGIASGEPLTDWVSKPVLKLDPSYSGGDLPNLKTYFTLGNSVITPLPPFTEEPIEGYKIDDGGFFVTE